jgi:uncharacterized protein (DUF362 family)/NAD-dependent dihydropyrimidine dehydrogenase PreA subunit
MSFEKVVLKKCLSYSKKDLDQCLEESLSELGSLNRFLEAKDRVLIKPNLLSAHDPDKAVTTHPLFVEAVIRKVLSIVKDRNNILIADSSGPSVPFNREGLNKLYSKTKMDLVSKNTGVRLNYELGTEKVSLKSSKILKQVYVIRPVLWADKIINLPKFKTHDLMVFTGAVKNMFGIIPGFSKPAFHFNFCKKEDFADILLDIAYFKKPVLNLMDGILGMEGSGPGRNGTPRYLNIVITSQDPSLLDAAASRIAGIGEKENPVLAAARKRGLPLLTAEQGMVLKDFMIKDFVLPKGGMNEKVLMNRFVQRFVMPFLKNSLSPFPYTVSTRCSLCEVCLDVCPANAMRIYRGRINIDYKSCIRCFCCSELCPEGAIDTRYSYMRKLLSGRPR